MTTQLNNIQQFFDAGNTQTYQFRKTQLQNLALAIKQHEEAISNALKKI